MGPENDETFDHGLLPGHQTRHCRFAELVNPEDIAHMSGVTGFQKKILIFFQLTSLFLPLFQFALIGLCVFGFTSFNQVAL
jgi:hypothetical protein